MAENETPTSAEKKIDFRLSLGQMWAVGVVLVGVITGSFGFGWSVSSWLSGGEVAKAEADAASATTKLEDLQGDVGELKEVHEKLKTKESVLRLFYFYHVAKLKEESVRNKVALAQRDLDHLIPFPRPVTMPVLSPTARERQEAVKAEYERKVREYCDGLSDEDRQAVSQARERLEELQAELAEVEGVTHDAGEGFTALVLREDERAAHLGVTLTHISKGGGGKGSIKFSYDDMSVEIPNEFLPKAAH